MIIISTDGGLTGDRNLDESPTSGYIEQGNSPLVTLVVPTYQRPLMLAECLSALRRQNFPRFVAFVCDNSPGREAEAVVQSMNDPRFHYHPRARNLGILRNVITGFVTATTPFVMEVDDDDILHQDCLEKLVAPLLRDASLVLSFSDIDVIDWSGQPLSEATRRHFISPPHSSESGVKRPFDQLAVVGAVYMVSTLLRRGAVDWAAVPQSVGTAYDRYAVVQAAEGGQGAYYVAEKLVDYRVHLNGDAYRHEASQMLGALSALEFCRLWVTRGAVPALEREIVRTRIALARAHVHERDLRRAWLALRPTLRVQAWRPLAGFIGEHVQPNKGGRLRLPMSRDRRRRDVLERTGGLSASPRGSAKSVDEALTCSDGL